MKRVFAKSAESRRFHRGQDDSAGSANCISTWHEKTPVNAVAEKGLKMTEPTDIMANAKKITREVLAEKWRLYVPGSLLCTYIRPRMFFLGYAATTDGGPLLMSQRREENTVAYFGANFNSDTFWLLSIHLPKGAREYGDGLALYQSVEGIARRIGCREVIQTPSGWASTGETRLDYLVRHGWKPHGNIEVRKEL